MLKASKRTSTQLKQKSTVFDRLLKDTETPRFNAMPDKDTESVSQNVMRKNLERPHKPAAKTQQPSYKPSFIKKQRRTLSNGETQFDESRLKIPGGFASELGEILSPKRVPAKQPSQVRAVEYLRAEPHKSRLKERLKKARAEASLKIEPSFVQMDMINRSNYWTDKRDQSLIKKREDEVRRSQEDCTFKPKLERPKSLLKLRTKEKQIAPQKRRTLSNSYMEIYNIKKMSSLSMIFGENVDSPAFKTAHSKQLSLDFSLQETPLKYKSLHSSVFSTKCSPTPDKPRKDYRPLSPAKRLYCFSSGFNIKQFIKRSMSPEKRDGC